MLVCVMLYLISILMYTQAGSVQQETRQAHTTNLRKYSLTLAIIKQHKGNNEGNDKSGENKTSE